ncbi:hypothetical protein EBU60_05230, partial [bacterium]|nr:hypothetical protein [bacterium]
DQAGVNRLVTTTVSLTGAKASNYTLSSTAASDTAEIRMINDSISISNDPAPTTITYLAPIDLNSTLGLGTGGLTWSVEGSGGASCSISPTTGLVSVTNANYGSGSCIVTVTKAADNNYNSASDWIELSTFRTGQIAFSVTGNSSALTYGSTMDLDTLGGSGTGNVSFAVTGGLASCSIDPASGLLSVTNAHGVGTTCIVTATKAGDANYTSTSASTTVDIARASDSITIDPTLDDTALVYGVDRPMALSVYGAGSGSITWAIGSSTASCDIAGEFLDTLVINNANGGGTYCVVTASKADDDNYNSATTWIAINIARAEQTGFYIYTSDPDDAVTYAASPKTTVDLVYAGGESTSEVITYSVVDNEANCSISEIEGTKIVTVNNVGDGACVVSGTKAGDSNYNSTSNTVTLTIAKDDATVTFDPIGGPYTYNDADFTVTAQTTNDDGATIDYASSTTDVCTVNATSGVVSIVGAGSCTITADSSFTANYNTATGDSETFTVAKDDVVVTANVLDAVENTVVLSTSIYTVAASVDQGPGGYVFDVVANASNCRMVDAVTDPGTGSEYYEPLVSDGTNTTGLFVALHAGSCTIRATSNGSINYEQNSANVVITVLQAEQTATAGGLTNENSGLTFGDADFRLDFPTNSGNPIVAGSYDVSDEDDGVVCTVDADGTFHIITAGVCDVAFSIETDLDYIDAVAQSFGIVIMRKAAQIELSLGGAGVSNEYNDAPRSLSWTGVDYDFDGTLDAPIIIDPVTGIGSPKPTDGSVTYSSSDTGVCTVDNTTDNVTFVGAGSCTITALVAESTNYYAASDSIDITVLEDSENTITFTQPAAMTYGDADQSLTASSNASLDTGGAAVAFTSKTPLVCEVVDGAVSIIAAGECTIEASDNGGANYATAPPVQKSFTVAKDEATVTLDPIGDKVYNDADFTVTA